MKKATAKKPTAGENLVGDIWGWQSDEALGGGIARRIDAAIRRAVREAWKARKQYDDAIAADTLGMDFTIAAIPDRIERKYGVRL